METLIARARTVAGDRDAGASELVRDLLPVLDDAIARGADAVWAVVREVCAIQPSMAPVWNACAAAVADLREPGRFARFREEVSRQARSAVRVAARALDDVLSDSENRTIVTWSYSATVAAAIAEVAAARDVTAICAEGRPRFEGRRLAAMLAGAGAKVLLMTDAGATAALERSSVIVVGTDALLADRWINKVGTRALAAAALQIGRPVIVVATRDKALAPSLEPRLRLPDGDPGEVWAGAPSDVEVSSPIFESVPAELATWFATDVGLLTAIDLPAFVLRYEADAAHLVSGL